MYFSMNAQQFYIQRNSRPVLLKSSLSMEGIAMLVLTRHQGESLHIGADVDVVVLGIKGNQVRIGVNAPSSVKILREEVTKRGASVVFPRKSHEPNPNKD